MSTITDFEETLARALQLEPHWRLQLIESLVSSLRQELSVGKPMPDTAPDHWGKALNLLLDELGDIELQYPDIADPVEWVRHLRAVQAQQRLTD